MTTARLGSRRWWAGMCRKWAKADREMASIYEQYGEIEGATKWRHQAEEWDAEAAEAERQAEKEEASE